MQELQLSFHPRGSLLIEYANTTHVRCWQSMSDGIKLITVNELQLLRCSQTESDKADKIRTCHHLSFWLQLSCAHPLGLHWWLAVKIMPVRIPLELRPPKHYQLDNIFDHAATVALPLGDCSIASDLMRNILRWCCCIDVRLVVGDGSGFCPVPILREKQFSNCLARQNKQIQNAFLKTHTALSNPCTDWKILKRHNTNHGENEKHEPCGKLKDPQQDSSHVVTQHNF